MSSLKQNFQSFFKRHRIDNKTVTLTHQRIYILPTRSGLGFVLLIVLLLMIAFVYNNNLAYLLSFLLASVFFVTILHSFKSLAGLVISQGQSYPAHAGEKVGFDIHIHNPNAVERFNLIVTLDDSKNIHLNAGEKQRVYLESLTTKRGWHHCGVIRLSCTYPLGLFKAWSVLHFDAKTLVYPKISVEKVPYPETAGSQTQQGNSKKGLGDFYGLKEYQEGDAIRDIHWKSLAKGQGLHSKYYSSETLAELWLDYEQASGHDTEQRLSQLCRWLVDADQSGLQYGFILAGFTLQPSSGSVHFKKCLTALALF